MLSVPRQREDYGTVIGWAIEQPSIDASRVFAWGTSFAGMHIVELAVSDSRLCGALAQSPLVDGLGASRMASITRELPLVVLAVMDRVGSVFGGPAIYLAGHGEPGAIALGTAADARFGERIMTPKDGTVWHNRVTARSLFSFSWRRPVRRAGSVRCPLVLVVPATGTMAPVEAAVEVTKKAPGAELYRSAGGHDDVYQGGVSFDDVLRVEVDFLHHHADALTS